MMFERNIKIGDYTELSDELRGKISDIRMCSTTITTNDNIDLVIPNKELIEYRVINWIMNDKIKRFRVPFGVAYGTDVEKVIEVVTEAIKSSGFKDLYITKQRPIKVVMIQMGASSLDFELFVWVKGESVLYPRGTTSEFLITIYKALNENGIEIPFPQQDLHIRSISQDISFKS